MILQLAQIVLKLIGKLFSSKEIFFKLDFSLHLVSAADGSWLKTPRRRKEGRHNSCAISELTEQIKLTSRLWTAHDFLTFTRSRHVFTKLMNFLPLHFDVLSLQTRNELILESSCWNKTRSNVLLVTCAIFSFDEFL